MHYVVTGGAGFIGSVIIAALEATGMTPISVIDDLGNDDRWLNIAKRTVRDIVPSQAIGNYLGGLKEATIIHMGARTSTADREAGLLAEVNVRLTAMLYEICAKRLWPFIWASSASVYGDRTNGELRPLTQYAWSKLAAERAILDRARAGMQPPLWLGLRLFNVYGPNEEHKGEQMSFVSKCFAAIRDGKPIAMFRGSDRFARDWVYVEDVARLIIELLAERVAIPKGVFDVGTGESVSFVDASAMCIGAANRATSIHTKAFPEALIGRYQAMTRADMGWLKEAMPNFRFTDLKHGARGYWEDWASKDGLARHP